MDWTPHFHILHREDDFHEATNCRAILLNRNSEELYRSWSHLSPRCTTTRTCTSVYNRSRCHLFLEHAWWSAQNDPLITRRAFRGRVYEATFAEQVVNEHGTVLIPKKSSFQLVARSWATQPTSGGTEGSIQFRLRAAVSRTAKPY